MATAPIAGGDTATATKLRLSDGTTAIMKTARTRPTGFFAAEAHGLRWLGEATDDGGVAVPEVLAVDEGCLILRWVESGKASADVAGAFGQALAATHAAGAAGFGASATATSPRSRCPTGRRHVGGVLRRAPGPPLPQAGPRPRRVSDDEAAPIEPVIGRLTDLLPVEPPARLHGDLWNGNVLWGQDGRVWLIDPAAYGGHRELDLAMLSLFGMPHLPRVLDAYEEVAPARRRLGGPGRRCTSCSRCSCTPRCSAAATAPARPRPPGVRLTAANGATPSPAGALR